MSEFRNSALATLSTEVDEYARKLHLVGEDDSIPFIRHDEPGKTTVVFRSATGTANVAVPIYDDPEPPVLDEFAMIFPCGDRLLQHIRKAARAVVHALISPSE